MHPGGALFLITLAAPQEVNQAPLKRGYQELNKRAASNGECRKEREQRSCSTRYKKKENSLRLNSNQGVPEAGGLGCKANR